MRHGFGFNTNLIETNVLNLRVVVRIVVKVVGDAVKNILDERRQIILSTLQEADKKERKIQQQLREAKKALETAQITAQEIRSQSNEAVQQENYTIKKKLDEDLKRFQESSSKTIKLERQQIIEFITQQVAVLAVRNAEYRLSTVLKNGPGPISLKQKELNKIHIQETFNRLKRKLSSKYLLSNIYNL
jgi:F-type H+-transporting ATPase subunit b